MDQLEPLATVCPPFECYRLNSETSRLLFPVRPQLHYFSEFLLVRRGSCKVTRGKETHLLHEGEGIYIGPMVHHAIDYADGGPIIFDVIQFSPTQLKELPDYLAELRNIVQDVAQAHLPVVVSASEVRELFLDLVVSACIEESRQQDFACDLRIRALIYMLISGLARFWNSKLAALTPAVARPDPLALVPEYIERHLTEPLAVADIAREFGFSYPWFAKRFRERYGMSCKRFIEYLRVNTVEQYLIHTGLDLNEISRRTGFTDRSHLLKAFRRFYDLTPGQYRTVIKQRNDSFPRLRIDLSSRLEPNLSPRIEPKY